MQFFTIQNNQLIFDTQKYFENYFQDKLDAKFYEACKQEILQALPDLESRKKLAVYGQVHRELTNLALQGFGKHAKTISVNLPHA